MNSTVDTVLFLPLCLEVILLLLDARMGMSKFLISKPRHPSELSSFER